jgi:bifunctional pyridoxal-dependent enzyme with beta-cystathionase and maltose regulon repressor activities
LDELRAGMGDAEILRYYRARHPHISLTAAKGTYRAWSQFRHLGALAKQRDHEAAEAKRSRLRQRLFGQNLEQADEVAE